MSKFCITGISGVGKSSAIKELNKRGIQALDVDEMGVCHWKNEKGEKVDYFSGIGKEWLDQNNYFCDIEKLKEIIDKAKEAVVVAGLVTNQEEFLRLFDKTFLLHCDKKTFLYRLNNRDTNDFAKDKSEQKHILGYYKNFEAKMLKFGAIPINTDVPLKDVVDKLILEMQK